MILIQTIFQPIPNYYHILSEHEEQDGGEADGSVMPPGCWGEDQEARHQVSARLQRSERRGKSYLYVPGGVKDNIFRNLLVISC